MRYFLLILLLAGGYYGWNYYQTDLVPRHEEIKALEMEPYPELDAAQMRFDELAELHEQQAARLQAAIQRKEEAVRKYWDGQMEKADKAAAVSKTPRASSGTPHSRTAEDRIARLLQQYDKRAADVEELRSKLNTTRQQLSAAQARLQEQIRQVETRLDIDRIQRAEASNTKSKEFKVTENRQELLKLQTSLPQELERITRKGEAMIRQQTEAWEKAKRELSLFQNKVDRQIASIRDTMNSPLAEEYDDTAILAEDPEFQAMIAPFDQAVSHEESLTMRTEANVEEQAKVVHSLQRIRDGSIEEYRSRLKQEEQIFFTAATVIGAVLLVSLLLSFTRRK